MWLGLQDEPQHVRLRLQIHVSTFHLAFLSNLNPKGEAGAIIEGMNHKGPFEPSLTLFNSSAHVKRQRALQRLSHSDTYSHAQMTFHMRLMSSAFGNIDAKLLVFVGLLEVANNTSVPCHKILIYIYIVISYCCGIFGTLRWTGHNPIIFKWKNQPNSHRLTPFDIYIQRRPRNATQDSGKAELASRHSSLRRRRISPVCTRPGIHWEVTTKNPRNH